MGTKLQSLANRNNVTTYTQVSIGTQDVKIKLGVSGLSHQPRGGGRRGKVNGFSRKARSNCETHIRNLPNDIVKSMLTLTYPKDYSIDGRKAKRDLDVIIKRLKRMGVSAGVWFLEFQKRGAPHFHLILNTYHKGLVKKVSDAWFKIVGSEDENHHKWHMGKLGNKPCIEPMRKPHAASYYAGKYASKSDQKSVPEEFKNVGRFWGSFGEMKPEWKVFWGVGVKCQDAAMALIQQHKARFNKEANIQRGYFYSSTLRGRSVDQEEILSRLNIPI